MKSNNILEIRKNIRYIWNKKILFIFPLAYMMFAILIWNKAYGIVSVLDKPYSSEIFLLGFHTIMLESVIIGLIVVISLVGKPLIRRKKERELSNVGFTDKDGNPPMLLSVTKQNKGIRFEFYSTGISLKKYKEKIDDIKTALNLEIESIVQGRDSRHVIIKGIKYHRHKKGTIYWNDDYLSNKDFELILGESNYGVVSIDLNFLPHVVLGGETNSGKSVLLKSLLMQARNKGADVIIVDFKGGLDYTKIWHDNCKVITEREAFTQELERLLLVLEKRRRLFVSTGNSDITMYNKKEEIKLNRIIIACDEIAEVLDKTGLDKDEKMIVSQIESKISTFARMGRAFGIHLFLATQRPDSDIVKGQIKCNMGYRICGKADKTLSQIILDKVVDGEDISLYEQGKFYMNIIKEPFKAYYVDDNCLKGLACNEENTNCSCR